MPVLRYPNKSTAIAVNTTLSSNWGVKSRFRGRIAAMSLQDSHTLPQIRMEKVLAIRQQIAKGEYDMDMRLDAVLDQLLENFIA